MGYAALLIFFRFTRMIMSTRSNIDLVRSDVMLALVEMTAPFTRLSRTLADRLSSVGLLLLENRASSLSINMIFALHDSARAQWLIRKTPDGPAIGRFGVFKEEV